MSTYRRLHGIQPQKNVDFLENHFVLFFVYTVSSRPESMTTELCSPIGLTPFATQIFLKLPDIFVSLADLAKELKNAASLLAREPRCNREVEFCGLYLPRGTASDTYLFMVGDRS